MSAKRRTAHREHARLSSSMSVVSSGSLKRRDKMGYVHSINGKDEERKGNLRCENFLAWVMHAKIQHVTCMVLESASKNCISNWT
jgi:hypothetical protein